MKQGLRHIKAFLALAELQNFSRVAERLHISPSTLTLQIQQLEAELNIKLFHRNKREVTLTEQGQQMIVPLKKVYDDYEYAFQLGQNLSDQIFGEIRIAILPTIASSYLPKWIKHFKESYPRVKIIVLDLHANEIQDAVKTGLADIGIGTQESKEPLLSFKKIFEDELKLFVHKQHPLLQKPQLFLNDIVQYPQILTLKGSSVYRLLQDALQHIDLSLENLDIACEVRYLSTAISLVEANIGLSILPATSPIPQGSPLLALKIVDFPVSRTIHMISRKNFKHSFIVDELMSCIQQSLIEL